MPSEAPHPVYGTCEPRPEAPLWNDSRSIEGRRLHYSWCCKCGLTWNAARAFVIPTAPGRGTFPVCTDCGPRMSVDEILAVLERMDRYRARFYPFTVLGTTFFHEPLDLAYAKRALLHWKRFGAPGASPEDSWERRPRKQDWRPSWRQMGDAGPDVCER